MYWRTLLVPEYHSEINTCTSRLVAEIHWAGCRLTETWLQFILSHGQQTTCQKRAWYSNRYTCGALLLSVQFLHSCILCVCEWLQRVRRVMATRHNFHFFSHGTFDLDKMRRVWTCETVRLEGAPTMSILNTLLLPGDSVMFDSSVCLNWYGGVRETTRKPIMLMKIHKLRLLVR